MNGGFVGDNIVPKADRLKKFDGLKTIRTFNFDLCEHSVRDLAIPLQQEKDNAVGVLQYVYVTFPHFVDNY